MNTKFDMVVGMRTIDPQIRIFQIYVKKNNKTELVYGYAVEKDPRIGQLNRNKRKIRAYLNISALEYLVIIAELKKEKYRNSDINITSWGISLRNTKKDYLKPYLKKLQKVCLEQNILLNIKEILKFCDNSNHLRYSEQLFIKDRLKDFGKDLLFQRGNVINQTIPEGYIGKHSNLNIKNNKLCFTRIK